MLKLVRVMHVYALSGYTLNKSFKVYKIEKIDHNDNMSTRIASLKLWELLLMMQALRWYTLVMELSWIIVVRTIHLLLLAIMKHFNLSQFNLDLLSTKRLIMTLLVWLLLHCTNIVCIESNPWLLKSGIVKWIWLLLVRHHFIFN
jgi:hypothetical protein